MRTDSLTELQYKFTHMVVQLLNEAFTMGYEISLGEAWRSPETAEIYAKEGKGIQHSLHIQRLAIDLNLFKDGVFLTQVEDYRPLGIFWESIGGSWGGRFSHPDADHFSLSPDGGMTK